MKAIADKKTIELGNDVVIISGGNVAIDAARSALRTGARNVTLICLEKKYEMPAWKSEIEEAIEECFRCFILTIKSQVVEPFVLYN